LVLLLVLDQKLIHVLKQGKLGTKLLVLLMGRQNQQLNKQVNLLLLHIPILVLDQKLNLGMDIDMDRLMHLPLLMSKQLALLLVLALDLYKGLHIKGQNKRLNLLDQRTHQRVLPLPLHLLMPLPMLPLLLALMPLLMLMTQQNQQDHLNQLS